MDWILIVTAIGAVVAALAASWQANETRKQVTESKNQGNVAREQFLQARFDEARPVLIITSDSQNIPVHQGDETWIDWEKQPSPTLEICNIGKGPALNVKSVIYGPESHAVMDANGMWQYLVGTQAEEEKENHWYHWITDAVSQGEKKELGYHFPSKIFAVNQFMEAHRSLESKENKNIYPFNAPKHPLESPNVTKEQWRICRVTFTYQDIFRRKHASIYDLIFRQGWQVVALLDDIRNDLGDLVG
jgi:type II secretory pathway pseudopilin PulG